MDLKQISRSWHDYFEYGNPHDPLPWGDPQMLSAGERDVIRSSIQQFQLGEGSDGKRLLRRGWDHGRETGDSYYAAALSLFVREEQRHSAYLARFMDRERIPRLAEHWLDGAFRWIRGLAGLELSIRVLSTAEVIAVPYYRALALATGSMLLKTICERILKDEYQHLRYQASNIARLSRNRSGVLKSTVQIAHCWFLVATAILVWFLHRQLFRAAGYRMSRLLADVFDQWDSMFAETRAPEPLRSPSVANGIGN